MPPPLKEFRFILFIYAYLSFQRNFICISLSGRFQCSFQNIINKHIYIFSPQKMSADLLTVSIV